MRIRRVVLPAAGAVLTLAACAYQPTPTSDTFGYFTGSFQVKTSLVTRTEHDLGCPLEQQTFKRLGGGTVGVSGCGTRATYKYIQSVGWVMDAAGVDSPAAPASAPAPAEPTPAAPGDPPPPPPPPG